MADTNDPRYNTGNPVYDALRFLCDASFAVLPRDAAQKIGEFEKNLWGGVRWFAEKNIGWIDDALQASDSLRDIWRVRRYTGPEVTTPPTPPTPPEPEPEVL